MARRTTATLLVIVLVLGVTITYILLIDRPTEPTDTTPPSVTITNPEAGEEISGMVMITFIATDESQLESFEIIIDKQLRSSGQQYSWNTSMELDGLHNITCRAKDVFDHWGEDNISVTTNNPLPSVNAPPVVTITSPANQAIVTGTVTIGVTITDEDSLVADIYINESFIASSNSYSWHTTAYVNGTYTIRAEATDSGALKGEASIQVTVGNPEPEPPPVYSDAVKVMTYNIEESGANSDWKEVVKEENPDILILVETGTWDDSGNSILNSVLTEFNAYFTDEDPYTGYCAQGITYSTSGEAILSRFPIIEFNQVGIVPLDDLSNYDVTHDFIEAIVQINGTDIHIIGSHLKASSGAVNENRRERETEGILNYMDNLGNVPIIYMGDLNSFSPADIGPLAPLGDLGYGPMTMMLYPGDPTYGQYASAVHNFTDVFRTLNPTDPGHTYGHQDPSYSSRIDYILVNSFFEDMLVNSTCGDTSSAYTGSDHYSVDVFLFWNTTTDSNPPVQVTGLNASAMGLSRIDIEWNANSEPDLAYYIVYRNGTHLATTGSTFYSDTGLLPNTTYSYRVSAKDLSGNEGNKSAPANATTWEGGLPDLVVLNEILPDPNVLYSEEWIELYNPQAYDTDMSGYILDDIVGGGTNPYTIPEGTIITAGGFLLFNQSTTGVALNNAGDTVNLIKPDGTTVQDTYTYASSSNDVSHGRLPDGTGSWTTMTTPTPGASNIGALMAVNHGLQIHLREARIYLALKLSQLRKEN